MTTMVTPFTGYRLPDLFDSPWLWPIARQKAVSPFAADYSIPEQVAQEAPEVVQQVSELARMTLWTHRTLGQIIGVTHPTVAKLLKGESGALSRSQESRERLSEVYAVV